MQAQLKKKGILFLIIGPQGSGKTIIAKKLLPKIKKKYGKTIYCDGDILRNIFNFYDYSVKGREKLNKPYYKFCNFIINQKINLIFSTVSVDWSKKQVGKSNKNFFEIYLNRAQKERKKSRKKIFNKIKNQKIHKTNFADIEIINDVKKNKLNIIVNKIFKKIKDKFKL